MVYSKGYVYILSLLVSGSICDVHSANYNSIGIGAGVSFIESNDYMSNSDDQGGVVNIQYNYGISDYLNIFSSYNYSKYDDDNRNSVQSAVVYDFPLYDKISPFIRAGAAYYFEHKDTVLNPLIGIGVNYQINPLWTVGLSYDYIQASEDNVEKYQNVMVNLHYRFDSSNQTLVYDADRRKGKEQDKLDKSQSDVDEIKPFFITFDFDKDSINKNQQDKMNNVLLGFENCKLITIDAYSDNIGPEYYNKKLSDRRLKSTIKYIVEKYPNVEIHGVSHGELGLKENSYYSVLNTNEERVAIISCGD